MDLSVDWTPDTARAALPSDLGHELAIDVEVEAPAPATLGIEIGLRTMDGNLAPALEVWTRNSIFEMDERSVCVRVIDRQAREVVPAHRVIGMRLVGGEFQEGSRRTLTTPLPINGALALFALPNDRFLRTSPVERVVQWIRVIDAPMRAQEEMVDPRAHHTPPPVADLGVVTFRAARGTLAP